MLHKNFELDIIIIIIIIYILEKRNLRFREVMNLRSLSSIAVGFEARSSWEPIVFILILHVHLLPYHVMVLRTQTHLTHFSTLCS